DGKAEIGGGAVVVLHGTRQDIGRSCRVLRTLIPPGEQPPPLSVEYVGGEVVEGMVVFPPKPLGQGRIVISVSVIEADCGPTVESQHLVGVEHGSRGLAFRAA